MNALGITIEEAGLNLEQLEIDNNQIMIKAMQILNSAKDDNELNCYLEALRMTQKALEINKNK